MSSGILRTAMSRSLGYHAGFASWSAPEATSGAARQPLQSPPIVSRGPSFGRPLCFAGSRLSAPNRRAVLAAHPAALLDVGQSLLQRRRSHDVRPDERQARRVSNPPISSIPVAAWPLHAANRIVMAPLTRSRADDAGVPGRAAGDLLRPARLCRTHRHRSDQHQRARARATSARPASGRRSRSKAGN